MLRGAVIWGCIAAVLLAPFWIATQSPLLAWRDPIYILAGFAGVLALGALVLQPLLAHGVLPGLRTGTGRRAHRWWGASVVALVAVHVAGLWLTSPPDVLDALLFRAPTLFAPLGVIAMWALVLAALLPFARPRLPPRVWRRLHAACVTVAVLGTVGHSLLIEGTMGPASKWGLCIVVVAALTWVLWQRRLIPGLRP